MIPEGKLAYYRHYLSGLEKDTPEIYVKLAQLLSQGQFEWLGDGRLVFLMNDTTESFIKFRDAKLMGKIDDDYEGEWKGYLEIKEDACYVIIHQGKNHVFTIQFSALELDVQLYNYGAIGHFWVEGQEDLRQLEYRLAILRDKLRYLGEDYVNEAERRLAYLADFPPIMTWQAVPPEYAVVPEDPWEVTEEAIAVMLSLASEAKDWSMVAALRVYRKLPRKETGQRLAHMLTEAKHTKVLLLIAQKLQEATAAYPERTYGSPDDDDYQRKWTAACKKAGELRAAGEIVTALREEPFASTADDMTYKVYLMHQKCTGRKRKVTYELYDA